MTDRKGLIERRNHKRFKVKDGAIVAIIRPNPDSSYICGGKIINISKGGIAFRYANRNDESNKPFELSILFSRGLVSFTYLANVPFKCTWISDATDNSSFNHLKIMHRGVQFGDMIPNQISQLDIFIQRYAIR
ncbi:PilZ domain-containing protein [Thermodesulfobacteriota bacterium]